MRRAARLYQDDPLDPDLPKVAFALDSSIISLSLHLFPWGYYARSRQAALKLHLLLSLQGNLPAWAAITEAHFPDMKMLDSIPVAAGPGLADQPIGITRPRHRGTLSPALAGRIIFQMD